MNSYIILDVREKDEYDAEHIAGSVHIPLSNFSAIAPKYLDQLKYRETVIMCRSGKRAKLAQTQISQLGLDSHIKSRVYEGGILEWKKQGNPVRSMKQHHLPIMRQVQLIAGSGVLLSILLSFWIDQKFAWIAAAIGTGLTVAGTTGYCGLAHLLARMPWNKLKSG